MNLSKLLLNYKPEKENILPLLKKVNAVFGFIGDEQAKIIAEYFSVAESQIYETASFYDLISTKKQPQLVIQVCSSVNCAANDSFRLLEEIEKIFKIKAGDVNYPKIRLEETSCLGRCGEGPVMVVNGKVYENVTKSSLHGILREYELI